MSLCYKICDTLNVFLETMTLKSTNYVEYSELIATILSKAEQCLLKHELVEILSTENEMDIVKLNDIIFNLFTILSKEDLIPVSYISTIKSACLAWMQLAIYPFVSPYFKTYSQLVPASMKHLCEKDKMIVLPQENIQFICDTLRKLFLENSILTPIVKETCFPHLISATIVIELKISQANTPNDDEFHRNSLPEYIRNILILMRCGPVRSIQKEISLRLSKIIITDHGLDNLIIAAIDNDDSSQKETTFLQRYQAIVTIVSGMPYIDCSLKDYYNFLSKQIFDLLKSKDENRWRIAGMLVNSLITRNHKLAFCFLIQPIIETFKNDKNALKISLNEAIAVVHRLIVCKCSPKNFLFVFSNFIYMRALTEETHLHHKTLLNDIIIEILHTIPNSHFELDNTLRYHHNMFYLYTIESVDNEIGFKFSQKAPGSIDSDSKAVDIIIQTCLKLIYKQSDEFQVDIFLLLLDQITFKSPDLISCALISELQNVILPKIMNDSSKIIEFVVNTIKRTVNSSQCISLENSSLKTDDTFLAVQQDSFSLCLQVLEVILKEVEKLSETEISLLKLCSEDLKPLISNSSNSGMKDLAYQIQQKLANLNLVKLRQGGNTSKEFEKAIKDLNDEIMPVRVHAIITLKKLINVKDKVLFEHKDLVINALKVSIGN